MTTILYLIRHHWLAFGVFLTASAVAIFFVTQSVMQMIWFNDPAHRDQDIAGWMTPGYISMSYRLPREKMRDVLDLGPGQGPGITLQELADQRGITVEALSALLMTAVQEHRK